MLIKQNTVNKVIRKNLFVDIKHRSEKKNMVNSPIKIGYAKIINAPSSYLFRSTEIAKIQLNIIVDNNVHM